MNRFLHASTTLCILLLCATAVSSQKSRSNTKPAAKPPASKSTQITLGALRNTLIGKQVIVTAEPPLTIGMMWKVVTNQDGRFVELKDKYGVYPVTLPESYQGKQGEVIAVQVNALKYQGGGVNALGEQVSDDGLLDPYTDVVVRFPDNIMAMTTSYPTLFMGGSSLASFRLVTETANRANIIEAGLKGIVGKPLYAVAYSRLYPVTTSLQTLLNNSIVEPIRNFPRAVPLRITVAKYLPEQDAVVIKLQDPSGTEYLTISKAEGLSDSPFLNAVAGFPASLITSLSDLTPAEIKAVKEGKVFVGMSSLALDFSLGFADKKNDLGRSGKQLVYPGHRIFVYLGADEKVRDWQAFAK